MQNMPLNHNCHHRINKQSPSNAKGNVRQQCMFEGLVRTKSKLTVTDPSNLH